MTTDRPILFLDHTAKLGGAELSIARYLRSDSALPSVLGILSPESVAPWNLPNDVPVRHTHSTAGVDSIRSVVSELRRLVDEVNPSCVIANSFSAAQYLAFVPKCGRKYFYFLRQEALPEGLGRIKSALNRVFVLRRFDGYFANSRWTASTLPPESRRRVRWSSATPCLGLTSLRDLESVARLSLSGCSRSAG